jgi:hypothetical protein
MATRLPAFGRIEMSDDLLPPKVPDGLTRVERQIAYRMVEGLPRPLTLLEAARAEGYRLKRARTYLSDLPAFNVYRAQLLKARRENEAARNLHTAIQIRDEDGDGSAAIRTVRLKACQFIEGKPDGASVVVNVNQTSNVISPGYVIKLPASRAEPAEPLTIDQGD